MNPKVDDFLSEARKWPEEMEKLRLILIECGLIEEFKWGVPCYMYKDGNILLLHAFKEYCALTFFKGALLKDAEGILTQPTQNTHAARQLRFTSVREILEMKPVLKAYIYEAVEVEKAGLKVDLKERPEIEVAEEFQQKMDAVPALKTAFYSLTPGRQKEYLLYFSGAKQSQTRAARVEKYTQKILSKKGFNDCTCGLSQKMPACDGSHKHIP